MKIQIENQKNSEVKMTVEISEKKLEEYKKEAVKELQGKVDIPGFREGTVPMEMLERHMGEQAFLSQVLDVAISASYEEAIKSEKLRPVAYPKISVTSQEPLVYEAVIPVVPEVKWKKDVKKLTVKSQKLEVSKAEMEEVLENLRVKSAKWKVVEREAKMKDRVELDFDGFDMDKVPLDGTSSKNHPVILGEGSLIPGFEEEVVGMKVGEEKDFNITFPKDYQAKHFQGKEVQFHIKLNQVEEPEEHELNDEFANEITGGNRKTLDELKEEVNEELMHQKEHQEDSRRENEFLKELLNYIEADVPEALLEREIDFMVDRIKKDLEKQGKTLEDYEKELDGKGKKLRDELKKTAMDQVLIRLGLEKLHEEEGTTATKEDIEKEIQHMLSHYPPHVAPMMAERYKEGSQEREYLKNQVMLRNVVAAHTK